MKRSGKTPPFRGPDGQALPGSVAEIKYLRLGGASQFLTDEPFAAPESCP
jgi:hypothetical protein